MDIKEKLNEIVEKLKKDPNLLQKFQKDPKKVIKELTGLDLPLDQMNTLVDGVKARLGASNVMDKLGDLGKLFGK